MILQNNFFLIQFYFIGNVYNKILFLMVKNKSCFIIAISNKIKLMKNRKN